MSSKTNTRMIHIVFFFPHRIGYFFPMKINHSSQILLVGRSNTLVQHLTHNRGGGWGSVTPLSVGTRFQQYVSSLRLYSCPFSCMYMYFLSHLLGFGCIDGVTFGEGVKRGEGVTHGDKTETAKYVQHMQQRGEHIHAEGGGHAGQHTYIGGNGTYVLTTLPPVLPF